VLLWEQEKYVVMNMRKLVQEILGDILEAECLEERVGSDLSRFADSFQERTLPNLWEYAVEGSYCM
jgi:hypothetical protein